MNSKWMKIGFLATALALVGALALSVPAFAQGSTPTAPGNGGGNGLRVRGAWGGPGNSLVAVAAKVLGMPQTELAASLAQGQSVADVASAQGVALDKIVEAMLAPRVEFLSQAVADGRLTQAQADALLATMRTNITAQLDAARPAATRGMGTGLGFVDANGDGVCDNLGTGLAGGQRGAARRGR
jgi:hypothetical protein